MSARLPRAAFLAIVLAAWWLGYRVLVPWVQRVTGSNRVTDPDLALLVGHWLTWQLPAVLLCCVVWIVGARLGFMPSLAGSLKLGGDGRRVVVSGLIATAILLVLTIGIGAAAGGTFGFHPPFTKMAGDLVSNLYEEIVNRGLIFCAFYGVVAGASFSLDGKLDRTAVIVATIGSCVVFAAGHGQYPIPLRVVLGIIAVVFAYPWIRARSLWAPWIPHMLGDVVGDSILKL